MFNEDDISKILDELILEGGIEFAGVDPTTNEILYQFTPKVKDLMPDLYENYISMVNLELMVLWEKGFVDIDFFKDDPLISITEKACDIEEIKKLSKEERWSLSEIVRSIGL
jgi:hypothetical protein